MFQEEQSEIDKSFMDLLSRILPKISEKSPGNDCVLDDNDGEFKKYFLGVAANKFSDAYHSYLFDARVKRNQNSKLNGQPIKIETSDSEENSESTEILADQETTITQSNCKEGDCKPTSAIQSVNSVQCDAAAVNLASNAKCKVPEEPSKKGLLFYCPRCYDQNSTNQSYDNAEEIHKHWVDKHAQLQQKFQFNVGSLFVCNLCEKYGTFPELKYHFKIKHHGKQFAIKDPLDVDKCGICHFNGDDLAEHFKTEHRLLNHSNIFSPMRLPKEVFDALKAIDVHKEYHCTICLESFSTKKLITDHYHKTLKHDIQKYPYTESSLKQKPCFKCVICDCSMDHKQMIQHFKDHELNCLICDEFKGKASELCCHLRQFHSGNVSMKNELEFGMKYFQTTIFYDNGLILNVANLLEPHNNENSIIQSFFQMPHEVMEIGPTTIGSKSSHIDSSRGISKNSEYLEQQWPLQKTLIIFGLPMQNHTSDDLMGMFGELYRCTTGRPINDSQIKSIYTEGRQLFVKLEEREQRDAILRSPLLKNLKTDDFLKLHPGIRPMQVHVEPLLTKYYLKIVKRVRFYIERKVLDSYMMRTWGLAIKYKANSEDVLVNSLDELENYVASLAQQKINHCDTSSKRTKY